MHVRKGLVTILPICLRVRQQRRQWQPTLAWTIPRTEEPGRLQSMGSQRVGHDLLTKQQQQQNLK